jgi:hypothetical protein
VNFLIKSAVMVLLFGLSGLAQATGCLTASPSTVLSSTFSGHAYVTSTCPGSTAKSAGGRWFINGVYLGDGVANPFFADPVGALSGDIITIEGNTAQGSVVFTVDGTRVVVTASPNPAHIGDTVTLTATVTNKGLGFPAPAGGAVTFGYNQNNAPGCDAVPLVNQTATCSIVNIQQLRNFQAWVGAGYNGDANNAQGSSGIFYVDLIGNGGGGGGGGASTSTALTSTPNPSAVGQSVAFTASVSGRNNPTGSVTFTDSSTGTALCSSVPLSDGNAVCSTSSLANGTHTISATYSGDTANQDSNSSLQQTVGSGGAIPKSTPSLTLVADVNPVGIKSSVIFAATVTNGTAPSGTVTFAADVSPPLSFGTTLCTSRLANGVATCNASWSTAGIHTISATYSGDSLNYGVGANLIETVSANGGTGGPAPSKLTLTTTPNPSKVGQPVIINLGLDSTLGGGIVKVTVDGNQYCSYIVPTNVPATAVACTAADLTQGTHSIRASWAENVLSSPTQTASPVSQVVNAPPKAPSTTTLTSAWNPSLSGQSILLSAAVMGDSPTGSVTFMEGASTLCTAQIVQKNGTSAAFCSTGAAQSSLAVGSHSLIATYSGDFNNQGSASLVLMQAVSAASAFNPNQTGLTGVWYNPATGGQGLMLNVWPDRWGTGRGEVAGGYFGYTQDGTARDWFVIQGEVDANDPLSPPLNLYTAGGAGVLNSPSWVPVDWIGTATLLFGDCGHVTLQYTFFGFHAAMGSGQIPLQKLDGNVSCSAAGDTGAGASTSWRYSGGWYNPSTTGQGMYLTFNPSQWLLFGAWYTYGPTGAKDWYTFQAPTWLPMDATDLNVPIYMGTGGAFNRPQVVTTQQVGTASITFTSCTSMTVAYTFTAGPNAGQSGTVNQKRLGPSPAQCH